MIAKSSMPVEGKLQPSFVPFTLRSQSQYKSYTFPRSITTVLVLEFRDEVFASISCLCRRLRIVARRADNACELERQLVNHVPDLVLLSATQPNESAWLTSAKTRLVNPSRLVWLYSPQRPSALDHWLSMVGHDDIIIYGGALHMLVDMLHDRLLPEYSQLTA